MIQTILILMIFQIVAILSMPFLFLHYMKKREEKKKFIESAIWADKQLKMMASKK